MPRSRSLAWLGSSALATEARAADALPKLGADLAATSVSGLSSGAYMAGQIQVAHAKDIVGAGIVAGGPYACAESAGEPDLPVLADRRGAERYASALSVHEDDRLASPTR